MVAQSKLLLTDVVRHEAKPLAGEIDDYDPLLKVIGDARLVLIGEASHGTHEFYRERAQITYRDLRKGDSNANKTDSKKRMAHIPRSVQSST